MLLANLIPNTVRLRFQLCREEREGERVLGFICQLFGSMGLFCEGVAGMYPSPLSLSLSLILSPPLSSSCSPGRSQTIVVVTAVQRAAGCCTRAGVRRSQSLAPLSLSS